MSDTQKRDPDDALDLPGDSELDDTDLESSDLDEEDSLPDEEEGEEEAVERLDLDVQIEARGACQRHVTVTIPRSDIDRCFDQQFSEMMPSVQVPGFRPGRAPRKLVEAKFRKEVAEKVKSDLLVQSLAQVNEEQQLAAIGEPEIDLGAVEIPDDGPLCFEFDLEVRPEFDVPPWKGLRIARPVREIGREEVDDVLNRILANRGRLVPFDGPAEAGDYVTVNLVFKHGERVLARSEEEVIRIRPVLSFRDGKIENFAELMAGARAGETRTGRVLLSDEAPNAELRGQTIDADFEVLDVKRLEAAELTPEVLDELGGFQLEADLRDAIKDDLERRLTYEQHRRAREQITSALTASADWELPPELLRRQSRRELERAVLELRRSGFSEEEILARENEIRQHSRVETARALKEHFILERIAEDEDIEAQDEDYEEEIGLIARQSGQTPRRVRAKLEKSGSMDVLRNQIIERKVIERIMEHAEFRDVPFDREPSGVEALDRLAGGGDASDIPEAKSDKEEASPGGRPEEAPYRE